MLQRLAIILDHVQMLKYAHAASGEMERELANIIDL